MRHTIAKKVLIGLLILFTSSIFAQTKEAKDSEWIGDPDNHLNVNLSVFYPLSINKNDNVSTNINLSWFYGRVGYVKGIELSSMVNHVKKNVLGFESAGILNVVEGKMKGFQSAGVVNYVGNKFIGFQTAGTVNSTGGNFRGLQTAGTVNYTGGNYNGVQISGTLNYVKGDITGLQVSVINIAKNVKGSQIGVINISKSINGIPIGLINYAQDGKVHPIAWYSNIIQTNIGIKFAVNNYFYSMLSCGYINQVNETKKSLAVGYYMGFHLPINKDGYYVLGFVELGKLYFDVDLGFLTVDNDELFKMDKGIKNQNMLQGRFIMGYELWAGLSLFAGIGENYSFDHDQEVGEGKSETLFLVGLQLF